jgi:hypothetical protein
MYEFAPRPDLVQLDDAGLADRLDRAFEGLEAAKKRFGWLFWPYLLSSYPRTIVQDPRDYWYPSQIRQEISHIQAEIKRRIRTRT